MKNQNKKYIGIFLFIILLVVSFNFIIAEEDPLEGESCTSDGCILQESDLSKIFDSWNTFFGKGIPSSFGDKMAGTDKTHNLGTLELITIAPAGDNEPLKEIYGQGIRYYASTAFGKIYHNLIFGYEDASLEIRIHKEGKVGIVTYNHIQKNTNENPNYMVLDNRGRIVQADFKSARLSKNYEFNNCGEILVPKTSRVQFKRVQLKKTQDSEQIKQITKLITKENVELGETTSQFDESCLPPQYEFSKLEDGTSPYMKFHDGSEISGKFFLGKGNKVYLVDEDDSIQTPEGTIIKLTGNNPVLVCFKNQENCQDKNENYILMNDNQLTFNSQEGKNIKADVTGKNYFNGETVSLSVNNGDLLNLESDLENGPIITHRISENGFSSIGFEDGKNYPLNKNRRIQSLGRFGEDPLPFSIVSVNPNGEIKDEFIGYRETTGQVCSIKDYSSVAGAGATITGYDLNPSSFEKSWTQKMKKNREDLEKRRKKHIEEGGCPTWTSSTKKSYQGPSVEEQINAINKQFGRVMDLEDSEKRKWLDKYKFFRKKGHKAFPSIKGANDYIKYLRKENKGGSSSLAGSINLLGHNMMVKEKNR